MDKKKNCYSCKHLAEDFDCDSDGHNVVNFFVCLKRDSDDIKLEQNLERKEYREKAKRCCEINQPN